MSVTVLRTQSDNDIKPMISNKACPNAVCPNGFCPNGGCVNAQCVNPICMDAFCSVDFMCGTKELLRKYPDVCDPSLLCASR